MDFTKGALETKPRITQTVNDASQGFSAFFDLDMSNISYADDTTAGTLVNTVTLPDPDGVPVYAVPMTGASGNVGNLDNGGRFDMATDTQNSVVTGGRYTFTEGLGWTNTGGADGYQTWNFEEGSYSYVGGDFDHLGQTWGSYFDAAQNPIGPGNESKCDSGAITGSCR